MISSDAPPIQTGFAVIGAGPAGLMAAETLAASCVPVTVYDRMPSAGRKLLMAGRGGLNLTHTEPFEPFMTRYRSAGPALRPALEAFPPERLRAWADGLGETTIVGSSGRVFPRGWKASPLLRAWLRRLDGLGVAFAFRRRWTGFTAGGVAFDTPAGPIVAPAPAATILALGGASWPRLGADGGWVPTLEREGVVTSPLRPANCGLQVPWSEMFRSRFAGEPLKRIALSFSGETCRGEAVVTASGLEGGPVYGLSGLVRDALDGVGEVHIAVDLRPDLPVAELARALGAPRGKRSASTFLRKAAGLPPVGIALLREAQRELPVEPAELAALIKAVPVPLSGIAGLERAISSAGGIRFEALDERFMLRARPGLFAAGEMLDWEAPTGGYLLQACFATGAAAAAGALAWAQGARPA